MAETEFVNPSGWRAKELQAKLKDISAIQSRSQEAQLGAFGRVRSLTLELASLAEGHPDREAVQMALLEAEDVLERIQNPPAAAPVDPLAPEVPAPAASAKGVKAPEPAPAKKDAAPAA
ncbi:hypothetical protein ACJ4V0_15620 [Phreatobacter sp. HK31-P]